MSRNRALTGLNGYQEQVGYSTVDAPAAGKFKAFAVQFENIGETTEIAIPDLFTYDSPKGAANGGLGTPDKIWLWDSAAGDWVKYYYRKVGTAAAVGWCKNGETSVTKDTVKNGDTVFFYRGSGATATSLTLSGGVRALTASAAYTTPEGGKFAFMAYPWPVAMSIGTFDTYQGAPKGAANGGLGTPDKIWLWDTTAGDWIKYYYRKVGTQAAVGWCKNGETTVTDDTIPAGEGFFFYRGSGAAVDTITFTPPAGN